MLPPDIEPTAILPRVAVTFAGLTLSSRFLRSLSKYLYAAHSAPIAAAAYGHHCFSISVISLPPMPCDLIPITACSGDTPYISFVSTCRTYLVT